jgi:hypothetical protein
MNDPTNSDAIATIDDLESMHSRSSLASSLTINTRLMGDSGAAARLPCRSTGRFGAEPSLDAPCQDQHCRRPTFSS